MSADTFPISPTRFASALQDLPLSSLHLKVLELRNNIAHLDYSNEQLKPFAEGIQTPLSTAASSSSTSPPTTITQQDQPTAPTPDPDCVEAIRENEEVIARMQERIRLIRAEVEGRGVSWTEFQSKEEADAAAAVALAAASAAAETNGASSSPWTDGTFQTGVIRDGQVIMNVTTGGSARGGGSITDEELRRRMEEQLRNLGDDGDDDEEGGLHL
ncbi:hypothetical protein B0T17DRAFT_490325 [Bombardia bombarda]|uniref:Uncharacterized protein n=1 Tax=Bombardia bombarda TaxID=252184 RepID=A0AA39XA55_9PEZI|nr:hypothetical protein B0T17DRAFT_490325 [Bombardia bombarda]